MFPIRSMYIEAINRASSNIWMTHAYFIPDQDFVDALKDAAQRGVDVRLLVPLKSNHIVADWISRGYFCQLLDAGVRIFRFQDAMVHAKTATIDGTWSTVGTANIDRLSLQGNYEINVEVIDEARRERWRRSSASTSRNCLELTQQRVGGARPAPQVHRDGPGAAAAAALAARSAFAGRWVRGAIRGPRRGRPQPGEPRPAGPAPGPGADATARGTPPARRRRRRCPGSAQPTSLATW